MDEIEKLINDLESSDSDVVMNALSAFGRIGKPAVPKLMQALRDKNKLLSSNAAWALVKIGKPAVTKLIQASEDEDANVRRGAVLALGNINDARTMPALIQTLKDENSDVRHATIIVFLEMKDERIKDARVVPGLIQALGDSLMRSLTANALEKIVKGQESVQALDEIRKCLVGHLREKEGTRQVVIFLLQEINKRKNQLIALDIEVDKSRIKPPKKPEGGGVHRMRTARLVA